MTLLFCSHFFLLWLLHASRVTSNSRQSRLSMAQQILDISSGMWSIETTSALHFLCIHTLPALEEDQSPLLGESSTGSFLSHSPPRHSWFLKAFWNLSYFQPLLALTCNTNWWSQPCAMSSNPQWFCSIKSILSSQQRLVLPVLLQRKCKLFLSIFIETATTWMGHRWSTWMTIIGFPITPQPPSHKTSH